MKYLVIVESPVKIKKLKAVLPSNYEVISTYGHLMDLDSECMALDFENDFEPTYKFYENMKNYGDAKSKKRKKDNTKAIKDLYKKCDRVVIASDLDREGEFIAESIKVLLKLKTYDRIIFSEISKKAILNAIANPIPIDYNKIHAQQVRRFMDRIFGYGTTPLLPRVPELQSLGKIKKLGCGRIQNIVTKIIIDREKKIEEFFLGTSSNFYKGYGQMELCINKKKVPLNTVTYETEPKYKLFKHDMCDNTYETILNIMDTMINCEWQVTSIKKRLLLKAPKPPHITATLQCEASTKLHWSIKKTMEVAQQLYATGYITYMRTDSTILSEDALNGAENLIKNLHGDLYYNRKQYSTDQESAQEAHEAIRPISMDADLENLTEDGEKLYGLIWKRVLASQMAKAEIESSQIFITPFKNNKPCKHIMVGSKSRYVFKGFTILDDASDKKDRDEDEDEDNEPIDDIIIPDLGKDIDVISKSIKFKEHVDTPPPRFTESQLVKYAVEVGVGRPATFVSMISKVQEKDYVRTENISGREKKLLELEYKNQKQNKFIIRENTVFIGNEKKRLVPTQLGIVVNNFLIENFPQIMQIDFTSNLEKKLDLIVSGKLDWLTVMHDFYDMLRPQIESYKNKYSMNSDVPRINNDVIIGTFEDNDINYIKIKNRFAIKCMVDDEAVWVSVLSKPTAEEAHKLIYDKVNNIGQAPKTTIIKTVGKYTIRQGTKNPFIQVGSGKNIKFCQIFDSEMAKIPDINKITAKKCKEICDKNPKFKKKSKS